MNKPTDSREKPDHTPDKVHMVYDSDTTDLRTEFKDKFSVRVEEWKDGFGDKSETHEIFIYKKIEDVLEWVKSNYLPKSESVSKSEMERVAQEIFDENRLSGTISTMDEFRWDYTKKILKKLKNLLTKDSNNQVK